MIGGNFKSQSFAHVFIMPMELKLKELEILDLKTFYRGRKLKAVIFYIKLNCLTGCLEV